MAVEEEQIEKPLTDDERNQKIEQLRERRRNRDKSDLAKVLGTPEGRRLMWRLMADAAPFRSPYAGAGNDSLTFLNIGKKEFALSLYADVEAEYPDLLTKMRREAQNDKLLHETQLKEAINGQ